MFNNQYAMFNFQLGYRSVEEGLVNVQAMAEINKDLARIGQIHYSYNPYL